MNSTSDKLSVPTQAPPSSPTPSDNQPTYVVAVRALCEFTAKTGDLDLRFTPSPTAREGMAGHTTVASRRSVGYQAEVPLSGDYRQLRVRGRADGYDAQANRLEEVKTHRGDLTLQPANHRALHWAQLKVYGWLLCQQLGLDNVELTLVYFDISSQQETLISERHPAAALRTFFELQCQRFIAWAEQEVAHRQVRNHALKALRFPYENFRRGQRPLAEAVYKAACTGAHLLAQAPTGIGKTLGTLFPQLKAMPGQRLDKLFFLAAKSPGRQLALHSLESLRGEVQGLPLRVLELVARDKACEHPDKACNGASCPLAQGFYDRLPAAREAALNAAWLDQRTLRATALEHHVCPYYLSQELARWADLVIGDYNYYFDLGGLLHGLTQANEWRIGVLVDEAHNLVERARQMYSAALDQSQLAALRRSPPAALKKPLDRLHRQWNALHAEQLAPYQRQDALPGKLLLALQQLGSALMDHFSEAPSSIDPALQAFYFDSLHFLRIAELFDTHSLFDIHKRDIGRGRSASLLSLRNLVPAPFLQPRFETSHSSVLFSATLSPQRYYRELLGLPDSCRWIDVESPFDQRQLQVTVVDDLSTRYQHRQQSLQPVVELIARQFAARPGNYLAFFSSFDYLQQAAQLFAERFAQVPLWQQSRRMDEAARAEFLARFAQNGRGIGFAVLGGAFGEGIDLPGERLIGAFIATLGLPQLNPVNEQIKLRMQQLFGAGYDYTYLYPGLQKVVQAAGRVIRGQDDRGVVYLIDDRFAQRQVLALLPAWWKVQRAPVARCAAPDRSAELLPG
ncbi:ATP-dependent DNA helicase [Pseudomonas sp.]|uniref:ATP-dependent DNA helicase n=1 Tax=Pseudomonas sp. TaxID=306 RepID=UPI0028B01DF1|nr:ATP-dependent DNA helicase [Pseudomonas sp.]